MPYAYMGDNCYGRGDYYQGDYYRGDPGIFDVFKGIGKAIGKVAGAVAPILPGPFGGAARIASRVLRGRATGTALAPVPTALQLQGQGIIQTGGLVNIARQQAAFGPPGVQAPVGTMTPQGFIPGCQLAGTRPNKSGYYKQVTKGDPSNVVYIPKGAVCVKARRINVANPRALRRSIRRAQGFAKLSRRVLRFVQAKPPKGKAVYKRAR